MKVNFTIDCTPEEARAFFGLPDVVPMQQALMQELQAKMEDNIRNLDPETLVKTWMPMAMQNWTDWQQAMWGQLGQANPMAGMMNPKATKAK